MKFSKATIQILKSFATVNTGIYLQQGKFIMTRSVNGATYGETTLPDGEEISFDVAIYDLPAFLSVLSLSGEDSDIQQTTRGDILIKGEGSEIVWPASDPTAITYPKKPINFPTANVEFDISSDTYNKFMRIARGTGCDTLVITNKEDKVVIEGYDKITDTRLEKPITTFEISDYTYDTPFNFIINMSNMKQQPDNYRVKLWATGDKFAAKFEGDHTNWVLAVESDSSHSF